MITAAILIPCYNSAGFLKELFEGIKAQTVPFDEIICYDDCSTDNTIQVAEELGAIVIRGDVNKGPAHARNSLIKASSSEWIHFHDSDDLIDPHFLEKMKQAIIDENTQILCNAYVFDRADRTINGGNINYNDLNKTVDQTEYFLKNVGFASMGLYSKKALMSVNGFNESLIGNEDPDLHIRLSKAGYRILSINEFLVTKLERSDSLSHEKWFQCMADKLKCLLYYSETLDVKYFQIIGEQSAQLSNFFYRQHDSQLSKQARKLAYELGTKSLMSSKFSIILGRIFGLPFYLWIYRRRVDFKLI